MSAPARPEVLRPRAVGIPNELKALPQWVVWRLEYRPEVGKKPWTKCPYRADGRGKASSTDPQTWATYGNAWAAYERGGYDGVGFVFTPGDPFAGLDLDGVVERQADGSWHVEPWADKLIKELHSYFELSPSTTGMHVIVKGEPLPEGARREGSKELYDSGRFFTMTGVGRREEPWGVAEVDTKALHERLFGPAKEKRSRGAGAPPDGGDEDSIIERARAAANGAKFERLWGGKWRAGEYQSQSEADAALCCLLAFWTRDAGQIDRLFRRSGLYRAKWDERHGDRTYGAMTVETALDTVRETAGATGGARAATGASANASFSLTDAGNAELFAHLYGGRLRYDHARAHWLSWGPHRWKPDPDGEVVRLAKATARHRYEKAAAVDDLAARQRAAAWAISSESRNRIDAMLALARAERPIADAGDGWDADPWLLGGENGVVELRTGTLRDGRREDRVTKTTGVVYDPAAECPRWLRFLDEVFEGDGELIGFVQRAAGYWLTGDTSEQVWFLLHGAGANGKGTFVRALQSALTDYAGTLRLELVTRTAHPEHPAELAALEGLRLVAINESLEEARLNEGRLKALTGQDTISARLMRENPREFVPQFKLVLATNYLPRVEDDSEGFWRRVRLIPFHRQFAGAERDNHLDDSLRKELPGILRWAVEGCLAWQHEGLRPPDRVMLATWNYRESQDVLGGWLAECCLMQGDARVGAADAYKSYTVWAAAQGVREKEMMTNTAFGRRMGARFAHEQTRRRKEYLGVGLVASEEGVSKHV